VDNGVRTSWAGSIDMLDDMDHMPMAMVEEQGE
jgi:hypothetical protein